MTITIFTLASCPHCKRAKALLADKGWSYVEVSLTDYPEKRNDMLELVMALMIMAYLLGGPEMMNNMMSMFQDMFGLGSDDASGSGASSLGDAMAAYGAYGGASGGGASGGVMMQSTSISIAMSQSTMSVSGGLDVLG